MGTGQQLARLGVLLRSLHWETDGRTSIKSNSDFLFIAGGGDLELRLHWSLRPNEPPVLC